MVVVVVLGILVAVAIPAFRIDGPKAEIEVYPLLGELAAKQERYKAEHGAYLTVPPCPATPSKNEQDIAPCTSSAEWSALGVIPDRQRVRCSSEILTGTAADDPSTAILPALYTPPSGCCASSWYILHASCDMDGDAVYSHFVSASFDPSWHVTNPKE